MISPMRTVVTVPDHIHKLAKQRASELGISFAEFTRRLLEQELTGTDPQGDIESIRGIVNGPAFDMALDGERLIGEATDSLLTDRRG